MNKVILNGTLEIGNSGKTLNNLVNDIQEKLNKFILIKEFNLTNFTEGLLNVDISKYNFILILTNNGSMFLSRNYISGSFTWNGWIGENINADRILIRSFFQKNNDIFFEKCYGRGINGYTGIENHDNFFVPKAIYGII